MKKTRVLLLFLSILSFGQSHKIDSLSLLLEKAGNNQSVTEINLQLAKLYERIDIKKGKKFIYQTISKTQNDSLLTEGFNQLARFYFFENRLDSASYYFAKTKESFQEIGDKKQVASVNISIGAIELRLEKL